MHIFYMWLYSSLPSFSSFIPIPLLPQYALQFIGVSVVAGLLLYYTYGQVANLKEEKLIKQRYVHKGEKGRRNGRRIVAAARGRKCSMR